MNVTFQCPQCQAPSRSTIAPEVGHITCSACGAELPIPSGAIQGTSVRQCVACPSRDLFVRKDFPQRVGVALVLVAMALSTWAWLEYRIYLAFGVLFAMAAIDVVLYFTMGDCLTCYRCQAMYRGVEIADHSAFDLEVHERHRQLAARQSASGESRASGASQG